MVSTLLISGAYATSVEDRIAETIDFMASQGSRVAGYPGCDAAADFIEREFHSIGLDSVKREEYEVTVPIDYGGTLTVIEDGRTFEVEGLWPNLVKTTTLPSEGIRGPLIYGGKGHFGDLNGKIVEGSIVLMEFNTWNRWLNPVTLGAEAILFIEPEATTYSQADQKHVLVPLGIERFWVSKEEAAELKADLERGPLTVEMTARMTWERHPTSNIVGWIPGRDPVLKDDVIVVEAYYDGMSVVPALTPGAEQACSIVGLLELARHLKAHPPARTVVFAATSAHFLNKRGIVDFLDRHSRRDPYYAKRMTHPIPAKLFIGLDLSSHTDELGIWNSTNAETHRRFFAPFGRRFTAYADSLAPSLNRIPGEALANGISPIRGMSWSTFVPGGVSTNSQTVLSSGLPALSFVTVNDARFGVDSPLDTPDRVNHRNLARQVALLNGLFSAALEAPDFFADLEDFSPILKDNLRSLDGKIRTFPRKSAVPDRPVSGAVVTLRRGGKSHKGIRGTQYELADRKGVFHTPGTPLGSVFVEAYFLEPGTGNITYAPDMGEQSKRFYTQSKSIRFTTNVITVVVFPCVATEFYDMVDPRYLNKLSSVSIIGPKGAEPRQFGRSIGLGSFEPIAVVFSKPEESIRLLMASGLLGYRMMLINSQSDEDERKARGSGFKFEKHGRLTKTSFQAARDMWQLDEARMRQLRKHGIENQRISTLHERAGELLLRAEQAEADLRWDDFVAYTRAAMGVESRAYPDVRDTQNDVIQGIVFFLALVIPTAFFAERLIFAASDIRWQLGWFGLLLLAIWIVISQVHPAFKLAHPVVILLAFAIMAMAVGVLGLILSRFNRFTRDYKTETSMVIYDTDISRVSASYAAFMLGVSNMRRRKLRTTLTLTTLVLLTFTVLSFTSFKFSLRFAGFSTKNKGTYPGALIRNRNWAQLQPSALEYTRSDFEHERGLGEEIEGPAREKYSTEIQDTPLEAWVSPRCWYISITETEKNYLKVAYGDTSVKALGILGVTPQEREITGLDRALAAGTWFENAREETCIMSSEMAERLGIGSEDVGRARVRLFGGSFMVRGLMDSKRMTEVRDLDGENLTPVDFQLSSMQAMSQDEMFERMARAGVESDKAKTAVETFVHLEPENVLILPYGTLMEAGGSTRSIAVRFVEGADVQSRIEDFLTRLAVTLFAGFPDPETGEIEVFTYTSIGLTSMQGLKVLIVPILIAALIVLNTMMGSVYERFREIGIYSSVGLAPTHIAFLFIAESCVYAVLGTTMGYLLGQATSKVLIWTGLLSGVSLNYSSVSAVTSALLVMAVVLLSALYPARMAARAAVPDVVRRWKVAPPEGDVWRFLFPFSLSGVNAEGLCSFLSIYFDSHSVEAIGELHAEGIRLKRVETERGPMYAVQMVIALAPFDMGVTQFLQFGLLPTETRGLYEIELLVYRLSGQHPFWIRVNQRFMKLLRKQFLIWQALKQDMKERYREVVQDQFDEEERLAS